MIDALGELTDEQYDAWQTLSNAKLTFHEIRALVFKQDYYTIRKLVPSRQMIHIYMDIAMRYKYLCSELSEDYVGQIINGSK